MTTGKANDELQGGERCWLVLQRTSQPEAAPLLCTERAVIAIGEQGPSQDALFVCHL